MAIKRAIIHYVTYFTLFTLMVVVVRSTNTVPEYALPMVAAFYLTFVYAIQCFRLTVSKPEAQFAYPDSLRRCLRLIIYMGWYTLLVLIPGAYLVNKGAMYSWHIGVVPLFLYYSMAQTMRPPVRLTHQPKSRDSRHRYVKYLALIIGIQLILAFSLVYIGRDMETYRIVQATTYVGGVTILAVCAAFYRLVVIKPHSRFDAMPKKARYKRLASIIATYLCLGLLFPWVIASVWRMNAKILDHNTVIFVFLFVAAYGSDGTPYKGVGFFSKPPAPMGPADTFPPPSKPESEERRVMRQKILEIKRRNEAAGKRKASVTA